MLKVFSLVCLMLAVAHAVHPSKIGHTISSGKLEVTAKKLKAIRSLIQARQAAGSASGSGGMASGSGGMAASGSGGMAASGSGGMASGSGGMAASGSGGMAASGSGGFAMSGSGDFAMSGSGDYMSGSSLPYDATSGSGPATSGSGDDSLTELKILTWNAWLKSDKGGTDGIDEVGGARADAIPEVIELLDEEFGDIDVVVFQELFDDDYREVLEDRMSDNGWYSSGVLEGENSKQENGGVEIFSKIPFDYSYHFTFTNFTAGDGYVQKGALYVKLTKEDQPFHIFGCHLQDGVDQQASKARYMQYGELAWWIDNEDIPTDEPVIYAGDFNFQLDSDETSDAENQLHAHIPHFLQPGEDGYESTYQQLSDNDMDDEMRRAGDEQYEDGTMEYESGVNPDEYGSAAAESGSGGYNGETFDDANDSRMGAVADQADSAELGTEAGEQQVYGWRHQNSTVDTVQNDIAKTYMTFDHYQMDATLDYIMVHKDYAQPADTEPLEIIEVKNDEGITSAGGSTVYQLSDHWAVLGSYQY